MNKGYLIALLLCMCLASKVQGQASPKFESEWNIGIGFGPTISAVDFYPNVPTKSYSQYHGGLAVRYISEKNLGVIAELNYAQNGWMELFKDNPERQHSHQLNYIEMPILTHIYFGNKVRFFINLGPKIGILLSESEKLNDALADYLGSGNVPLSTATHQYYRSADNKFDYGLTAGLGLEFRTKIGSFSLEGRYNFGLSDIYSNKKTDYFSKSSNQIMSARVTYYTKLF